MTTGLSSLAKPRKGDWKLFLGVLLTHFVDNKGGADRIQETGAVVSSLGYAAVVQGLPARTFTGGQTKNLRMSKYKHLGVTVTPGHAYQACYHPGKRARDAVGKATARQAPLRASSSVCLS